MTIKLFIPQTIRISFMYHDVFNSDVNESGFKNIGAIPYKLKSNDFEHQISLIAEFCESRQIEKNQVALTFDDGGESFHSIIAPVLEKYGFFGYFFITTEFIGSRGFMDSKQIIDLQQRGHIIGTHSHTHPKNIAELSITEIDIEWSKSVEILNKILSEKICTASIPGGFYSEKSRISLKKNGINMIFTSIPTHKIKQYQNQYIVGRYTIKKGTTYEDILRLLKNNSLSQFYEYSKWRGLAMIRSLLGNNYYLIREILLKNHK